MTKRTIETLIDEAGRISSPGHASNTAIELARWAGEAKPILEALAGWDCMEWDDICRECSEMGEPFTSWCLPCKSRYLLNREVGR